ncbi:alpha/beta fold hydrolase [Haloarchaeobius litoreus]|uniref:alpha/beta fold hydrolase n=1 Tax=Haloarchaeobius litoreus TaxID=755306 RepID=UPI0036F296A0
MLASTGTAAGHPFVRVGDGPRTLLVVPGLNDPLHTVGDSWWYPRLMALYLRRYADTHTGYMVSRPHGLASGTTVSDLARGYERVLDALDVGSVDVLGLSMGGFVVQHLAADDDRVDRAVLGLSGTRLSESGAAVVRRWRDRAAAGHWGPIYRDAAGILAAGARARLLQAGSFVYDRLFEPVDPTDFLVSADACLAFDGRRVCERVTAPTLVVGADRDPFFDEGDYRAAADALPDGRLAMLRGTGHEAVVEHPAAFDGTVRRFLSR